MQTIPELSSDARGEPAAPCGAWGNVLAILIGIAFTLVVRGYQFGGGNHNVYLLEPLRESSPPLLAHDWFTTQTLQYHGVYNRLCVWLIRLHALQPAFLVGYLGLVALLHVSWFRWVRAIGGTRQIYLLSVVLFYLSAAGLGLGMYDFFQDASFLPSNIASVLMLWGMCCWVTRSRGWAGVWLGIAGLFHLNYALVGIGTWGALSAWQVLFSRFACEAAKQSEHDGQPALRGTQHGRDARVTQEVLAAAQPQRDTDVSPVRERGDQPSAAGGGAAHAQRDTGVSPVRERGDPQSAAGTGAAHAQRDTGVSPVPEGPAIDKRTFRDPASGPSPQPSPLSTGERGPERTALWRQPPWWIGTLALLALSIPNILPAVRTALTQSHHMPLTEFVALYVRVRHPHHYDPSSWPIALWISFLWPFPLALLAARRSAMTRGRRETYRIVGVFAALLGVALIGAGVWYVSEPLIQMSLFRFSVYPKLLSCIGAAYLICGRTPSSKRVPTILSILAIFIGALALTSGFALRGAAGEFLRANRWMLLLLSASCAFAASYGWLTAPRTVLRPAVAALLIGSGLLVAWSHLGLRVLAGTIDSADYLAICDFAKENTPMDAVFLVPPQEESMRLHGQRAVVVNFKCVPQFSGELGQWRDRLQDVLDLRDLRAMPHRFDLSIAAVGRRYDELPAAHLERIARQYGATYIVATHPLEGVRGKVVFARPSCLLYALDLP